MSTHVELSDDEDLLYVRLRDGQVARTDAYGDHRLVDLDAGGAVLGAEFIGLVEGIDLRGLPDAARLRDALLSHAPPTIPVLSERVSPSTPTTEHQPVPWFHVDGATARLSSHHQDANPAPAAGRTESAESTDDSE